MDPIKGAYDGCPWNSSKLFFRADEPGQKELRAAMRTAVTLMNLSPSAATYLTWLWLREVHGGDEQGEQ